MSFKSSLEKALNHLSRFGLQDYRQIIEGIALPAYLIKTLKWQEEQERKSQKDKIHSKMGGNPDLPKNFVWPMRNRQSLAFLAQINLEELENIPNCNNNLVLPKKGLISIFLPLLPDSSYEYLQFANWDKTDATILYFDDLSDLIKTDHPKDYTFEHVSDQEDFVIIGHNKIKNPKFDPKQPVLTPPLLIADPDGSYDTYFKALDTYSKSKNIEGVTQALRTNPEFIMEPIFEIKISGKILSVSLDFTEQIFDFEVFASFPYWGEFDLFFKNGIPDEVSDNINSWIRWWNEQNNYSGSSILGYPQSAQGIDRKHIANEIIKINKLVEDTQNKLWHLFTIGFDFSDYFIYGGLSESNNFYLYQKDSSTLDLRYPWIDINSD